RVVCDCGRCRECGLVSAYRSHAAQFRFHGKHVGVVHAEFAQGLRQLEHVVTVAAAWPGSTGDVARNRRFVGGPEPRRVFFVGDVHDAFGGCVAGEVQGHRESQIAIFLAVIEMPERCGRDAISHPRANCIVFGNQGGDATRVFEGAAMVVRALPQTPGPAADRRGPALDVRKIDLVDQRAVAEQPHAVDAAEILAQAIDRAGVVRRVRRIVMHVFHLPRRGTGILAWYRRAPHAYHVGSSSWHEAWTDTPRNARHSGISRSWCWPTTRATAPASPATAPRC